VPITAYDVYGRLMSKSANSGRYSAFFIRSCRAFLAITLSLRSHIERMPLPETIIPRCSNSFAALYWPKAGFSIANSITACSTYSGTRFFSFGFLRLSSCSASTLPLSYKLILPRINGHSVLHPMLLTIQPHLVSCSQ
jgi:hypothetical protein